MTSFEEKPSKKKCTEDGNDKFEKCFTPRSYQIEILETARTKNTIACLGTGTGKTFIAVMLIRHCADEEVHSPFDRGGKRIFFLVPTVPLVHQQAKTIKEHTDLKVKKYSGDMNVDSWNKDRWMSEFQESEVLVMTAEIFRIIIAHTFIPLNRIKLIIFDECHRAQGDHPYSQAMKCFTSLDPKEIPRIFGLSASLINGKCKPTQLEKQLQDLEKTLRSSITTASDIVDLQRHGADPIEFLVCYEPYSIETRLLSEIDDMRRRLEHLQSSLGRNSEFTDDADVVFFDKPIKCLNSMDMILRNLGPWCAIKGAEIFIAEISCIVKKHSLMKDEVKLALCQLISFLESIEEECKKFHFQFTEKNVQNWPHKLQRLLEIFLAIRKSKKFVKQSAPVRHVTFEEDPEMFYQVLKTRGSDDASSVEICSIVFVEQRITAYVLYCWVLEIKSRFPQLDFLIPEYIVGHGSYGVKQTSMSEKRQKAVLTDFRQKKCNVLISTCVLEEGMDVQQCNVVIRFDLPFDFRAYVQSKGRARAKNSIYVLMSEVGDKHTRFCMDMCNFKTVECMLLDKCHNRPEPNEDEINEFMTDVFPPYMPYGDKGPRITLISAISLINRYCANLPSDMATKLTAKWSIKEMDPDNPEKQYQCVLKMPINSPLREPIVGQIMRKKKLAKMAAALKACQMLNEIGELNEHLVPVSSILQEKIEEEIGPVEEEDGNGAIPGTKRRRQPYNKHVPVFLQNSLPQPLSPSYLHVFRLDLAEPLPKALNPRNRPIVDPSASSRGVAILLSKKLPKINSFPLFTKIGKVVVTVSLSESVFVLSADELRAIEDFHKFVFSDALYLDKNKEFAPTSADMPFYIVPINTDNVSSSSIDWHFMKMIRDHPYSVLKKNDFRTAVQTQFSEALFRDAVLLKSYQVDSWKYEKPSLNHVIRVTEKNPNSVCDFASNLTFKDYYKSKYGIEIQDERQPLVETITNGATVNWKPLYVSIKEAFEDKSIYSKTKQRHMEYKEFLVPELSIIHPFPSAFLLKVQYLPTILFRLQSLLLAEELRQAVAECRGVGHLQVPQTFDWPYFDLETSDKELRKRLVELKQLSASPITHFVPRDILKSPTNKIVDFTPEVDLKNHSGPNPSLLLQALTTKSAGDEFDLERLEMIGDSFLKYAISVKTYIKYPSFDEGKLTKMRSRIIQNLHLYQLAKKKSLPEFLINTSFSCKSTWLPPCYSVSEKVDKISESQHYFTKQIVSDKCIADSVEALIGAYLLSCGQKGALMFMSWLGLNPLPHKKDSEAKFEDFLRWPPDAPSAIVSQIPGAEKYVHQFTVGYDRFEAKIKYKFKDRALLLQAFTHPSFSDNEITDCFQRLEFLGDAVLDFLITRQLYEDPNDHSPGKLTDLRSALVNNIYFASLAVQYEYHKYLKMASAHLFGLINRFLTVFEDSAYFKHFKEHGYHLEEIECFELDEVEVPKALGDIFESVAGAIFLDSGMSLNAVWDVYYPMIAPAMGHLTEHVPLSPVRELYEITKKKDVFSQVVLKGEKAYVLVTLPDGRVIEGVGPNKKVAKRSAAKRALAELKKEPLLQC